MSKYNAFIKAIESQLVDLTNALTTHPFKSLDEVRFVQGQYRGMTTVLEQFKDLKKQVEGGYDD